MMSYLTTTQPRRRQQQKIVQLGRWWLLSSGQQSSSAVRTLQRLQVSRSWRHEEQACLFFTKIPGVFYTLSHMLQKWIDYSSLTLFAGWHLLRWRQQRVHLRLGWCAIMLSVKIFGHWVALMCMHLRVVGGDCCAKKGEHVKTKYCHECLCKDPDHKGSKCIHVHVGDGFCDDGACEI